MTHPDRLKEIREKMQAPGGYRPSTEECRLLLAEIDRLTKERDELRKANREITGQHCETAVERDEALAYLARAERVVEAAKKIVELCPQADQHEFHECDLYQCSEVRRAIFELENEP